MRRSALTFVLLSVVGATLLADNWPHWRGPSMDGRSTEKSLPSTWSATENVAWKLPLPAYSGSTPIVWNDMVFLNVATERATGQIELWAVDRNKKAVAWKRPLTAANRIGRKQNMASPSPVTDGTHVWVITGTGIMKAFDFAGKELWTRDVPKDHGAFGIQFGYASSPLLHGDALYLQVLHGFHTDDPSYVLKIDKRSGKTVWRTERPTNALHESPDSYSTPALLQYNGKTEIVITGGDLVTGHDPVSGKELWRADVLNPTDSRSYRIISSPIIAGGLIIAPTRVNPLVALRPGGSGDISTTHVAWTFHRGPDVPSPVSDGEYSLSGQRAGRGVLPRAQDRNTGLRAEPHSQRLLQLVAGAGRRQDLRHGGDDRGHHRLPRRTEVRDPVVEHLRRSVRPVLPRLARGFAGAAVRQDGREPVGGRRAEEVTPRPGTGRADKLPPWTNRRSS